VEPSRQSEEQHLAVHQPLLDGLHHDRRYVQRRVGGASLLEPNSSPVITAQLIATAGCEVTTDETRAVLLMPRSVTVKSIIVKLPFAQSTIVGLTAATLWLGFLLMVNAVLLLWVVLQPTSPAVADNWVLNGSGQGENSSPFFSLSHTSSTGPARTAGRGGQNTTHRTYSKHTDIGKASRTRFQCRPPMLSHARRAPSCSLSHANHRQQHKHLKHYLLPAAYCVAQVLRPHHC
jgi:hypothetical protein